MTTSIERRATELRRELVTTLIHSRALISPEWSAAFTTVPRHLFVPAFYRFGNSVATQIDGRTTADRDQWLSDVYSDTVLVTALDQGNAVSSSTQPSLMAIMLEALSVTGFERQVLEVGTGTGYNAALLCHRLGSAVVTTIDINQNLLSDARIRLSALGYAPTIAPADGANAYLPNAPYDRIIATCRVSSIPPAWLSQAAPGAVIVTSIGIGVARLVVAEDGTAIGRFLPMETRFMPMRSPVDQTTSTLNEADAQLDRVVQWWRNQGSPRPERLGITATEQRTVLWIDRPSVQFVLEED